MPKKMLQIVIFLSVLGLLFLPGCKTAEDAAQYTLTVTVAAGVNGTPVSGSYGYEEGDTVPYNYSPQAGYENLEVKLDGAPVADSGVVTMNMNHTLTVTADEKFNPNGNWGGWIYQPWGDYYFDVTFSGDYAGGTVSAKIDTASGVGTGTYSVSGNTISFAMVFFSFDLECTGTIVGNNNMNGEWYSDVAGHGTWELTRL